MPVFTLTIIAQLGRSKSEIPVEHMVVLGQGCRVVDLIINPQSRLVGSRLQKRSSCGRVLQVKLHGGPPKGAGKAAKIGSGYYDATILQRDCTTAEALLFGQASQRNLPGVQGCSTPSLVAHLQPIDWREL